MDSKSTIVVPKGIIVDWFTDIDYNTVFILSGVGFVQSQNPSQFFVNSSKSLSFILEPSLVEGLGGSIFISSPTVDIIKIEKSVIRLNRILKSLTQATEINLLLVGSGFRVSFEIDTIFQHGFSLHLQLGSKKAIVRVP